MPQTVRPEFERNLGFLSVEEQNKLTNSTVAIAGAGGDGGLLALTLARFGIENFRLADPDPFEIENINRQACCTSETIGVNKAVAVGDEITKINPAARVELYTDGITPDNAEAFVAGSDLVIDETEFTLHAVGVALARAARRHNIPNLMAMNIGFGATVTSFEPSGGMTFEKMLGLSEKAPLDEIASAEPSLKRWLPYVPPYADIEVFKQVASGEKSAPSVASGVALAAGIASPQALLHLFGGKNNRPQPVTAPKVFMVDAYTGESKKLKLAMLSHYKHLGIMVARNMLKRNPRASY